MEQDTRALLPTQGTAWATASAPVARLQGPQGDSHQACSQEPHSPSSAEAPYCDLPRCPPALQNPLRTTTCVGQSVHSLGLGLGQEPQRVWSPTTALPAEGPAAAPKNRHQDSEGIPYLEGLARSSCTDDNDNKDEDEDPNSNTSSSQDSNTPHDTSNSSSVDWDTTERPGVVPSRNRLTEMIPRRPQEGLRADSARKATRSPARGDTAGQRKEILSRFWQWWTERWPALGKAAIRKRLLLSGATALRANPGFLRDTTERTSGHHPGFFCPKGCFPGCSCTRSSPNLLSAPKHPKGHTAEHP